MSKHRSVGIYVKLTLTLGCLLAWPSTALSTDYYVRQSVGDDANDGKSPDTAWRSVSKLSGTLLAGDTAYVGRGLYRDKVYIRNGGTAEKPITFIGDATGRHTGDPPGTVMMTGAEPVDESIFVPHGPPGVYRTAPFDYHVLGMVEMGGEQRRYVKTTITMEHQQEKMSPVDVVAKLSSSFYYDREAEILYFHTSDDRPPTDHEIELFRRTDGISIAGKDYVAVEGFTFRHYGDTGVRFSAEARYGRAARNTSYGSRQGVRVYGAKDILVSENTLFGNENSGVYFAKESTDCKAIGNVAYRNAKGVRWSSESSNGEARDNTLFDNFIAGIAVERASPVRIRKNRLLSNVRTQLFIIPPVELDSRDNCFESSGPEHWLVEWRPIGRYPTLADYQKAQQQDLDSKEGNCGPLPAKVDVHELHAETMAYAASAAEKTKAAAKGDEKSAAGEKISAEDDKESTGKPKK